MSAYIYNGFWKLRQFWILEHVSQEKNVFFWNFGGQNQTFWKILDSHLVESQFPLFWHLLFAICFSIHWSAIDTYSWRPFLVQNRMTWRHRNVIFWTNLQPNLATFSEMVSNWCPIRYWKFGCDILRSCQVIANIRQGAEYVPSAGRGGTYSAFCLYNMSS